MTKKFTNTLSIILLSIFATKPALAQIKYSNKKDLTPKSINITNGFADIVEDLLPAVVNISAVQEVSNGNVSVVDQILSGDELTKSQRNQLLDQIDNQSRILNKKSSSIGSGFIISKDGYIVTNNHVIEDAEKITVGLNDGSKYKATLIGVDKKTDLALLKISTNKELSFVKFGDSTKARIGDWTIVIGNPYGLGSSVSVGVVSARGRDINNGQYDDFIQTDAAINKGNSGGPLFNLKGEVIGISTVIFSPSGGNVGIGFATPSSTAEQIINQLHDQGEVTRGWLGVSVQEVTSEIAESIKMSATKGAFVNDVTENSPASKAGIVATDIIIKFDDQEITDTKTLPKAVAETPVGKSVRITLLRRGKIKIVEAKITKMKEDDVKKSEPKPINKKQLSKPVARFSGLGLAELSEKIRKDSNIENDIQGLLISDVNNKSEAYEKGVMAGDIILSANQAPVKSISDLKKAIDESKKSTNKIFLFIKRANSNYAIVLSTKQL